MTARIGVLFLLLLMSGNAFAQPKTDVVRLANGDVITGEVSKLDRGRLEYKTDDEGTIYIEWDKIASLQAKRQFEVTISNGQRFLGSLLTDTPRSLVVVTLVGQVPLPMADVTMILPIGESFWKKLDGSIDIGYSYTRSSHVSQLNLNTTTTFRKPAFDAQLSASGTITQNGEEGSRDDRGTLQASYLRYHGPHLIFGAGGSFETNESLGLILRSQVAAIAGSRIVNTNRARASIGAGLAVNREQGLDTDPTENLEGLTTFRFSYFLYDRPKTNVDISFQYYPSLSNWGRQRVQLDSGVKREFWKDVFLSVNVFDTFDSRPPNPSAERNDVGVVLAFGWSY